MKYVKLAVLLIVLFSCVGLFFNACSERTNNKILDEDLFVKLYCDAVTYADLIDEDQRTAFVDSVLASEQASREDFQRTVAFYSKDSKRWQEVFAKIVAELEQREKDFSVKQDSTIIVKPEQVPAVPFIE